MLDSLLFNPNPASLMRHQPRVVDECERIMRNCYLNCNNVVLRGGVWYNKKKVCYETMNYAQVREIVLILNTYDQHTIYVH